MEGEGGREEGKNGGEHPRAMEPNTMNANVTARAFKHSPQYVYMYASRACVINCHVRVR
jgi:hypothetical protein